MFYCTIFKRAVLLLIAAVFGLMSCTSTKKVVYFNDLPEVGNLNDTAVLFKSQMNFETLIQKNDQLWISIGGSNPPDLIALNSGNGAAAGGIGVAGTTNTNSILGYLVDADGNVKMPFIGNVKAEGLTRQQLEFKLTELFKEYTKNPIVNVRFLNYSFSVMGEVAKGGRFNMPTERVTILEALSLAGDLTTFGRRDNILVVREQNGKRTFGRLNLLSKDIFLSPYFYINMNDVIYVEPINVKFFSRSGVGVYAGVIVAGAALALSLLTTFTK